MVGEDVYFLFMVRNEFSNYKVKGRTLEDELGKYAECARSGLCFALPCGVQSESVPQMRIQKETLVEIGRGR